MLYSAIQNNTESVHLKRFSSRRKKTACQECKKRKVLQAAIFLSVSSVIIRATNDSVSSFQGHIFLFALLMTYKVS